jgi:ElaB/YqjD/DUF883 family membrane-anchored ribosome-binding protein
MANRSETYRKTVMDNEFGKDVNPLSRPGTGVAASLKEQFGEKAAQAKDAMTDLGRKTIEGIDAQRGSVAVALDQTASGFRHQADKAVGMAHAAADTLHATADYVRRNDTAGMAADVRDLVRRYPVQAIVVAITVGFFAARVLRTKV